MKYVALIYTDAAREPAYGTPEFGAMMQAYFAFSETLAKNGHMVAAEALQGIDTATSVRVKAGKVESMDGPFAETKEYLGGYYVMDVPDLDTAMKYAAMIPSAGYGTVELRPIMDYSAAQG